MSKVPNLLIFSKYERDQMVLTLLNNYERGLTVKQIATKMGKEYQGDSFHAIQRIVNRLEHDKKIKIIDFGRERLCKVISYEV